MDQRIHRDDVVAAYPEQSLTAWDTDVDVVMSTRADLVVETGDGYLVRETKSVGAHHELPQTAAEVFERYLDLYEEDGRDEPPLPCKLANRLDAPKRKVGGMTQSSPMMVSASLR